MSVLAVEIPTATATPSECMPIMPMRVNPNNALARHCRYHARSFTTPSSIPILSLLQVQSSHPNTGARMQYSSVLECTRVTALKILQYSQNKPKAIPRYWKGQANLLLRTIFTKRSTTLQRPSLYFADNIHKFIPPQQQHVSLHLLFAQYSRTGYINFTNESNNLDDVIVKY